jgi:hypothetical protein
VRIASQSFRKPAGGRADETGAHQFHKKHIQAQPCSGRPFFSLEKPAQRLDKPPTVLTPENAFAAIHPNSRWGQIAPA